MNVSQVNVLRQQITLHSFCNSWWNLVVSSHSCGGAVVALVLVSVFLRPLAWVVLEVQREAVCLSIGISSSTNLRKLFSPDWNCSSGQPVMAFTSFGRTEELPAEFLSSLGIKLAQASSHTLLGQSSQKCQQMVVIQWLVISHLMGRLKIDENNLN